MQRLQAIALVTPLLTLGLWAFAPAGPGAAPSAPAFEVPDRPPERLFETATDVVDGEVRAVYTREERDGSWRVTRCVAEIAVTAVSKGDSLEPGELVYVRYFHRRWSGWTTPPPSTNGHRYLPEAGQLVTAHLARNESDGFDRENDDGGYNLVFPNGFLYPEVVEDDEG